MKIIEVHWSDERADSWYWARRITEGTDEAALKKVREEFARHPRERFGEIVTPTFRVRDLGDPKAPESKTA